jgi:hypothetical protein
MLCSAVTVFAHLHEHLDNHPSLQRHSLRQIGHLLQSFHRWRRRTPASPPAFRNRAAWTARSTKRASDRPERLFRSSRFLPPLALPPAFLLPPRRISRSSRAKESSISLADQSRAPSGTSVLPAQRVSPPRDSDLSGDLARLLQRLLAAPSLPLPDEAFLPACDVASSAAFTRASSASRRSALFRGLLTRLDGGRSANLRVPTASCPWRPCSTASVRTARFFSRLARNLLPKRQREHLLRLYAQRLPQPPNALPPPCVRLLRPHARHHPGRPVPNCFT